MPCVDFLIQHHPARAAMLPALFEGLPDAYVVTDPDLSANANPWRTYRACLYSVHPDATHACVLQDDVRLCAGFAAAVCRIVQARPDHLLALFHGGQPGENHPALARAAHYGHPWAPLNPERWIPAVALIWPARYIPAVLEWTEAQNYPGAFRADDEIIGRACRALSIPALASVPSLVQHDDVVPSLVGRRALAGADPGRVAVHFTGADPAGTDWHAGP